MRFSGFSLGFSLELSVRGMYARMAMILCFGSRAQCFGSRAQHQFKVLAVHKMCMLAGRAPREREREREREKERATARVGRPHGTDQQKYSLAVRACVRTCFL